MLDGVGVPADLSKKLHAVSHSLLHFSSLPSKWDGFRYAPFSPALNVAGSFGLASSRAGVGHRALRLCGVSLVTGGAEHPSAPICLPLCGTVGRF